MSDQQGNPADAGATDRGPLRGAAVDVDGRRVAIALSIAVVGAVLVLIAVLVVAGVAKNSEIDELHGHGVRVAASVVGCRGNLGGSGSNGVGYTCSATYRVGGRPYVETLPGSRLLTPGATVHVIIASTDPGLVTTPRLLAAERSSWRVFELPVLLAVVLLGLLGALALARGRTRGARAG